MFVFEGAVQSNERLLETSPISITYIISVLLEQTRLALLAGRARAATNVVADLSKTLLSQTLLSMTSLSKS